MKVSVATYSSEGWGRGKGCLELDVGEGGTRVWMCLGLVGLW